MESRKAASLGLLGAAVALGALVMWPRPTKPAAPSASTSPQASPAHEEPLRRPPPRPAPSAPRPLEEPTPSLPASAYEPMIDMPAPPPPEQGAGDDLEESKLPRRLFEGKVALEAESPSPARLEGAEKLLGRPLSPEERARVIESFRKHDEQAAVAIGSFRLGEENEEQAVTSIRRAEEGYRRDVMSALGISRGQFGSLFDPPARLVR